MSSPFAFLRHWNLGLSLSLLAANRQDTWFAVALKNGALALLPTDDAGEDPQILQAHEGALCCLVRDADHYGFLSGGSNGDLVISEPGIPAANPIQDLSGEAILDASSTSEGLRAFASEKTLYLLNPEGAISGNPLPLPEKLSCLSFGPKGLVLTASYETKIVFFDAHCLQRVLFEKTTSARIQNFLWKPDRKELYLLFEDSSVQAWSFQEEPFAFLCARTLKKKGTETLSSLTLSSDNRFLLASGETRTFCWSLEESRPFFLGSQGHRRVSSLAPSPRDPLVAIGYDDGAIILAPFDGHKELVLSPPVAPEGARVVGLVWNRDGDCLHAALENGHVFLFTLKSVTRFIKGQAGR